MALVDTRFRRTHARRGAAAVEMAVLTPLLVFLSLIATDFARIFYFSQTLSNCARNGALYECDSYIRAESPYPNVQAAALADAANLTNPAPTVTTATGIDGAGLSYVEVTVSCPFQTITNYPGIGGTVALSRTVRMAVAPPNPEN